MILGFFGFFLVVLNYNDNDYEYNCKEDFELNCYLFFGWVFGVWLELFVVFKLIYFIDGIFVVRFIWVYKGFDIFLVGCFFWIFGGFWYFVCEVFEGVVIGCYRF